MKDMMYIIEASQMKDGTNPCACFAFEASTQDQIDSICSRFWSTYSSKLVDKNLVYGVVSLMGTSGNTIELRTFEG